MAYAKINEEGQLTYATIKSGALLVDGMLVCCPESEYSTYGYYKVQNVMEDGTPALVDGVIKNYIGKPQEQSEYDKKIASINSQLADTSSLMEALERMVAANGATAEDKAMAEERIALRDELGKVVQTEEGDGTAMNPYKWVEGDEVVANMWYKTPSNYIWQAIKDGVPSSDIDTEYFDVIF